MGTISYGRTGEIVEVIIRDYTGAKVESHVCNLSDKKKLASIMQYLEDKYGFVPEIKPENSVNNPDVDWWGSGI